MYIVPYVYIYIYMFVCLGQIVSGILLSVELVILKSSICSVARSVCDQLYACYVL